MKKINLFIITTVFLQSIYAQDILTARSQGVGANVTVTGVVTNGDELGPIRYIEDGTAGLALYDLTTNLLLSGCVRGDSVTVSGTLVDYNGLLELNPTSAAFIHSNNNPLPQPQNVTPNQIGEATESELVQIDNVIFNSGGSLFTVGTHDFVSNSQSGKIYIRTGHPLENSLIPSGPVTLIFSDIGKSTPKVTSQKFLISDEFPGSCPPKSFEGIANTTNPFSRYCCQSCTNPSYCEVKPHREAVFTTRTTLPLN